jgi:hypothetical protein
MDKRKRAITFYSCALVCFLTGLLIIYTAPPWMAKWQDYELEYKLQYQQSLRDFERRVMLPTKTCCCWMEE